MDVASVSTTRLRTVLTHRRLVNIWGIVARPRVTRTMEEEAEEGTRTVTHTAIGTLVAGTATVTPTDATAGTAGTGANVVALLLPEADGTLLTGGAGATPGALQEAAAPAGITMRPLRRRWQLPPPTPAGKLRCPTCPPSCNWSKGNKKIIDGQGGQGTQLKKRFFRFHGASSFANFPPFFLQNPVKTGSIANDPKLSSFPIVANVFLVLVVAVSICFASTKSLHVRTAGWATSESREWTATRQMCPGNPYPGVG